MLGAADPIRKAHPEVPAELELVLSNALRRYADERYLTVADLAAALMPFARKGALSSTEAAIRIVQRSGLRHGPLPQAFDSLAPPAIEETRQSPTLATAQTQTCGLMALQSLNLALLVKAQNDGVLRRAPVQADNVPDLLDEKSSLLSVNDCLRCGFFEMPARGARLTIGSHQHAHTLR